jgi:hypothetical protein
MLKTIPHTDGMNVESTKSLVYAICMQAEDKLHFSLCVIASRHEMLIYWCRVYEDNKHVITRWRTEYVLPSEIAESDHFHTLFTAFIS